MGANVQKRVVFLVAAFAVGVAVGWFAAGAGGERCSHRADADQVSVDAVPPKRNAPIPDAARPRRNAPKRVEEKTRTAPGELAGGMPKEEAVERVADNDTNLDNPFPRYLDMFKNNPESLAAEFIKEADEDRANQRKMRAQAIAKLKMNAEQAAFFEKALDDLRDEITRQNQEWVGVITSGQLNNDTAADGRIWSSNPLLGQRMVAARETAVRETAEKLYEQLVLDGVSDAEEQNVLFNAVNRTAFSYECNEPNLAVYDKVYKNMGFGKGIFSWCKMKFLRK